jgi:hypothetical protein
MYGELRSVARDWSDQMAANGGISHNPNLGGQVSGGWSKLGENVGVGWDVAGLMSAFVASPGHYRNIVDPSFNYIGVGVTYDGEGRIYTTHDFMALDDGSSSGSTSEPAPDESASAPTSSAPTSSDPAPKQKAAAAPASDLAPVADAASADSAGSETPPPPPATSIRVHTVLTALRAVGT